MDSVPVQMYVEKRGDKWAVVTFDGVDVAEFVKREDAAAYVG